MEKNWHQVNFKFNEMLERIGNKVCVAMFQTCNNIGLRAAVADQVTHSQTKS
jgi:hypothetical protein